MTYSTPPTFTDDVYLSAYKLRLLAANDDHQNGVADAVQMIPATMDRGFVGDELTISVFDGYLYLTQNTVKWAVYLSGNDDSQHVHVYFDYGGAHQVELLVAGVPWATVGECALQTLDVSNKTNYPNNAIYRVYAELHRATTGTATAALRKCYEVYTGALAFTATDAFADGDVSAVADFQNMALNDTYFRAIESENHPLVGITRTVPQNTTHVIWRGWVKHKHDKVFYKLQMAGTTGWTFGGTMTLYYGYGDALVETVAAVSTEITSEGSHTLVNAFVAGTWYQVAAVVVVGDSVASIGTVHYLETGPSAKNAGFIPMGEFNAGQLGWGTTANQRARFALLAANDTNLNGRLVLMNPAVKKALYSLSSGNIGGVYAIRRRKNVLYYRGKDLVMAWGTNNSASLNDYDGSHPFWTLDLGGVQNLAPGQVYTISSTTSQAEWAQEREA